MWEWHISADAGGDREAVSLTRRGEPATFRAVLEAWRRDEDFRATFTAKLRDVPYQAYCWETPPLSRETLDQPFECVFVESKALESARPDPEPFRAHFPSERSAIEVVSFESLGRDAVLVAPCPRADPSAYTHLAAFVRLAPIEQVHTMWCMVAEAVDTRLGTSPIWLSTAGLGVHWLHVRLDSRPKYYRHRAYAAPDYRRLHP
jgi:hypothetical protein